MIAQLSHQGHFAPQLPAPKFGHQHRFNQRVVSRRHSLRLADLTGAIPRIHMLDALGALHGSQ